MNEVRIRNSAQSLLPQPGLHAQRQELPQVPWPEQPETAQPKSHTEQSRPAHRSLQRHPPSTHSPLPLQSFAHRCSNSSGAGSLTDGTGVAACTGVSVGASVTLSVGVALPEPSLGVEGQAYSSSPGMVKIPMTSSDSSCSVPLLQ